VAKYPKLDLPPIPDDLDVRLQSPVILERIHDESEDTSYFNPIAHTAIQLVATNVLDSPGLIRAADMGVGIFEALGYQVEPDATYADVNSQTLVSAAAELFVGRMTSTEVFLQATEEALRRMEEDTPHLTEVLTEVLGHYTQHDPVSLRFGLRGAAAIRGMQIFVDKRLEILAAA
jgi:hypothetical protein